MDRVWVNSHDEDSLLGEDCYLGFDLSSTRDITSVSLMFPPTDTNPKFRFKNFNIKTNNIKNRVRKNGFDLSPFIESGELVEVDSPTIDYDYIFDLISGLAERYNILKVGYDMWSAALLTPKLKNEGLMCEAVSQSVGGLSGATKYLEKIIYDEDVLIDNALNKWMFGNIRLYFDSNGNVKPMKNKKGCDTIDGVMAMLNCLSVYLKDINEDKLVF